MRPRFGATAVGVFCLVGVGCAPALWGSGRANDGHSASIACRESRGSSDDTLAPSPFVDEDDELAPDPFAEASPANRIISGPPRDDDVMAPDPFVRQRNEKKLFTSRPIGEDGLAPDPFAQWRQATRPRNGRPLAVDELAPDPFAERASSGASPASRRAETRTTGHAALPAGR